MLFMLLVPGVRFDRRPQCRRVCSRWFRRRRRPTFGRPLRDVSWTCRIRRWVWWRRLTEQSDADSPQEAKPSIESKGRKGNECDVDVMLGGSSLDCSWNEFFSVECWEIGSLIFTPLAFFVQAFFFGEYHSKYSLDVETSNSTRIRNANVWRHFYWY